MSNLEHNDRNLPNSRRSAAALCELLRNQYTTNKETKSELNQKAGGNKDTRFAQYQQPCPSTLLHGSGNGPGRIAVSTLRKPRGQVGRWLHLSWYEL